jgi:glycosyltransferase involved in cell wall biosynthesis
MRVTHYYPVALQGEFGSATAVRQWAAALAAAGADVTLAVDRSRAGLAVPDGVDCVELPHSGRGRLAVPRNLDAILAGQDLLVVHGGWVPQAIAAGRAATRMGVPYLVTPHGAYHPRVTAANPLLRRTWNALVERDHLRSALGAHVYFDDEREHLARLAGPIPAVVAPNGVGTRPARWDPAAARDGYLAWVGRYDVHGKGLDLLLGGLARLEPSERPMLRLHGADHDGGRAATARLAERLGIADRVSLGGRLHGDDKWRFLLDSDGLVFPSRYDACPLVVGEALALGLPSLVTGFPLGRRMAEAGAAVGVGASADGVADGLRRLRAGAAGLAGGAVALAAELAWPKVARAWLEQAGALLAGRPAAILSETEA